MLVNSLGISLRLDFFSLLLVLVLAPSLLLFICFHNWFVKLYSIGLSVFLAVIQVCGLKWSYDNRELASGGNDNRVCNQIWYVCILAFALMLSELSTSHPSAALCLESTFNTTCTQVLRTHSSCKSNCMVSPSSRTSCFWRRNSRSMHSFLEHNYQHTSKLYRHWQSGEFLSLVPLAYRKTKLDKLLIQIKSTFCLSVLEKRDLSFSAI